MLPKMRQLSEERWLLHVAIWWMWLLQAIWCQSTSSQTGCTFADGDYTYNIELLPGTESTPCPSEEALSALGSNIGVRTEELYQTAQELQRMTKRLSAQNDALRELIKLIRSELEQMRQQAAQNDDVTKCPYGYTIRNDTFNSCYMFIGRYLSWYEAEDYCMSTGGHLVAVESKKEQEFLVSYVQQHNVLPGRHLWTGGNDIAREDAWIWAGFNIPFNFTNWLLYPHPDNNFVQMPDNYLEQEHCVHLFHLHGYEWNDLYCGNLHYFACEYKLL